MTGKRWYPLQKHLSRIYLGLSKEKAYALNNGKSAHQASFFRGAVAAGRYREASFACTGIGSWLLNYNSWSLSLCSVARDALGLQEKVHDGVECLDTVRRGLTRISRFELDQCLEVMRKFRSRKPFELLLEWHPETGPNLVLQVRGASQDGETICGTVTDVSGLYSELLRHREKAVLYQDFMDATDTPLCLIAPGGQIIKGNQAWSALCARLARSDDSKTRNAPRNYFTFMAQFSPQTSFQPVWLLKLVHGGLSRGKEQNFRTEFQLDREVDELAFTAEFQRVRSQSGKGAPHNALICVTHLSAGFS